MTLLPRNHIINNNIVNNIVIIILFKILYYTMKRVTFNDVVEVKYFNKSKPPRTNTRINQRISAPAPLLIMSLLTLIALFIITSYMKT